MPKRLIASLLFVWVACLPVRAAAPSTQFGILYEPWHCLVEGRPIYDISEYLAGRQALGP
jgi:hypothetical protein